LKLRQAKTDERNQFLQSNQCFEMLVDAKSGIYELYKLSIATGLANFTKDAAKLYRQILLQLTCPLCGTTFYIKVQNF
jgi:hypothetical protein